MSRSKDDEPRGYPSKGKPATPAEKAERAVFDVFSGVAGGILMANRKFTREQALERLKMAARTGTDASATSPKR